MTKNKTIEMEHQYNAPSCKVVGIKAQRVLCMSVENESFTEENVENW